MKSCSTNSGRSALTKHLAALVIILAVVITVACSGNQPNHSSTTLSSVPAIVTEETKNPLPDLSAAIAAGRPLYMIHCSVCHGENGKGESTDGNSFGTQPPDLTIGEVTSASDGKLFLIIKNGIKKDGKQIMPPAKKVSDEQIWQLVTYVRSLAQK